MTASRPTRSRSENSTPTPTALNADAQTIITTLEHSRGRLFQATLRRRTGWTEQRLTAVLTRLSNDGLVTVREDSRVVLNPVGVAAARAGGHR